MVSRVLRHLFDHPWRLSSAFPHATLNHIEAAVKASESHHRGEIRFAIESSLPIMQVLRGHTSRQRAMEVFGALGVWNTEENSGVLIYVLLAEQKLEIIADRGITQRVDQRDWDAIAHNMEMAFRKGEFLEGALAGIEAITHLLEAHFPPRGDNPNELPDKPVIIKR